MDVSKFSCKESYTFGDMTVVFGKYPLATTRNGAKSDYFNSSIALSLIKIRNGYIPDLPPVRMGQKHNSSGRPVVMTTDELIVAAEKLSKTIMEGTITDQARTSYIIDAWCNASQDLIALRKRNENLLQ